MTDGAVEEKVVDKQELRGSNRCTAFYFCQNSDESGEKIVTAKNRKPFKNSPLETANLT